MDTLSASERSRRMALIKSRDTGPEKIVRSITHGMGYRYRLQGKNLPGRPDLVFRARCKVIFVHGCFWHMHKGCANYRPPKSRRTYWKPKLERNAIRDKEALGRLKRLGWRSLVIWECELGDLERLSSGIRSFLESSC